MNSINISKNDQSKAFDNLKSDFFLRKLFDLIKINKSLAIIKHNKKLQKRTKLTFNDYKEFSQLYSSIEIELKISDNKYGKFINIKDNENVKMIRIIIDYQVKSFKELFKDCEWINSIFFKKF